MPMTTIEDLAPEHFEIAARWLSQPRVNQWLTEEWRGRNVAPVTLAMGVRKKKNRFFLVRYDGQPCGVTSLADIEPADATAMIWYFLGEQALSGRGITSEAVRQVARKAFNDLGLASLYAWAMDDNIASIKVLQKAGFRPAGRIRKAAFSNGRLVDRVYFDLLAQECSAA
jgi:RimJ/RimL family protein N-acetyltransferase